MYTSTFIFSFFFACSNTISEERFIEVYTQERCAKIFSCVAEEEQESLAEIYGSQEECAAGMKEEL